MAHSLEYDYAVCDLVLDMFDNISGGFVSFEQISQSLRKVDLPDHDEVYAFLVEEGLLKETRHGYEVTHKGRIVIHEGGFKGRLRRSRLIFACSVVAAVGGVVAAVASLLALFN